MAPLLIKNAMIVTMDDDKNIIPRADILIDHGLIEKIGQLGDINVDPDMEVINGADKVAMPGLINGHTHAAMTLFRGYADDLALQEWLETKIWPREAHLTPEDVYWGSKLAIVEMIKGGTTCFADMYWHPDEVAKAVQESGIRASLCGVLVSTLPTADDLLKQAVGFVERWQKKNGRITTMFGPHALYTCKMEHLQEIGMYARKLDVGIHIHLLETKDERKNIEEFAGLGPFQVLEKADLLDLPILAAHCVYIDDIEIDLVKSRPFHPVHNPGSNLKLASGIAPVPEYIEAGIPVCLGTDGAASNNNLDIFEEIRMAALIHKVDKSDPTVVSAYQALEMATRNGAVALGLKEQTGQIKEGMKADIILVGLKKPHLRPLHDVVAQLVYSASASDVVDTIIDGTVIMRDQELVYMDEKKVCDKASSVAFDLMNRS